MSPERPHRHELYNFTEQERLWDRVSHERLLAILQDEHTTISKVELASNSYGEFLFVSTHRSREGQQVHITFWGLGYHEYRDRWLTDTWFWHESYPSRQPEQKVDLETAQTLIRERQEEVVQYAADAQQSQRGQLFEMLADLTDDDGALADFDDMADWLDQDFE